MVWGGGFRFTHDQTNGTLAQAFDLASRSYRLNNLFGQDSMTDSVDVSSFAHRYDRLRSQEPLSAARYPIVLGNTLKGASNGVELAVNVQPLERWRTHVSYRLLDVSLSRDRDSRDVGGGLALKTPRYGNLFLPTPLRRAGHGVIFHGSVVYHVGNG